MTRVMEKVVTARAALHCDARGCGRRWESPTYTVSGYGQEREAATPAFDEGWRVYVSTSASRQYTFCPSHGPKRSMRLVHGSECA